MKFNKLSRKHQKLVGGNIERIINDIEITGLSFRNKIRTSISYCIAG
jgi:hypothetical protein